MGELCDPGVFLYALMRFSISSYGARIGSLSVRRRGRRSTLPQCDAFRKAGVRKNPVRSGALTAGTVFSKKPDCAVTHGFIGGLTLFFCFKTTCVENLFKSSETFLPCNNKSSLRPLTVSVLGLAPSNIFTSSSNCFFCHARSRPSVRNSRKQCGRAASRSCSVALGNSGSLTLSGCGCFLF